MKTWPLGNEEVLVRALLVQDGLSATNVVDEEAVWTKIISTYKDSDRPWTADIVSVLQ